MLARENDDDRMGMNLSMPAMNKQEAYLCVKCGKQLASNAIICIIEIDEKARISPPIAISTVQLCHN
jgi:hypothetical protein